jgi:hypothetical protein
MSIGNLKDTGNQGNNMPWQWQVLRGLQCICDELKEININTDGIEKLLQDIIDELAAGIDVTVVNGPGVDAVNIQDGGNSITVDATSLDIRPLDCSGDSVSICSDGTPVGSANPLPVQIQGPLNNQIEADSVSVVLTNDQFKYQTTPNIIVQTGVNDTLLLACYSISFASVGTADAIVSFDGGPTQVSLAPGTTINMDAGGLGWNYNGGLFYWDTTANAGASLIITYNY